MQKFGDRVICSPSDLNHFLECEHLVELDCQRDPQVPRPARDAHSDLLAEKGAEHERAWLERFRAGGHRIIEIAPANHDWDRAAEQTLHAMRARAGVIYQGVFVDDGWRGISDFLVRVDRPSSLGDWSYEAWDTKLARSTKTYFVLQLCFYSGQLGRVQGITPEAMRVVLGTGEVQTLRYRDFDAYYRSIRTRFQTASLSNRATYPYPVAHCALCEYHASCEQRWKDDDHLSQVAGIRRQQVERLMKAGIRTAAELAGIAAAFRIGITPLTLDRLRHQARLQTEAMRTGTHRYELLRSDEHNGFRLLPPPSAGDVFFDMEGDPYFTPARGLEYLFGAMTIDGGAPAFRSFLALTRDEEKAAFEQFVDFLQDRLRAWPDLHVYHYASYETTALKRLMSEHATREDAVDDLLRRDVFVDLYQVVRQSIRISHPSYSIKKVRTFFMPGAGQGAVTEGGDSILEFERWRRTADARILQGIVDYNEEDCLSTVKLRDWLIERRDELHHHSGVALPWRAAPADAQRSDVRLQDDAATMERCRRLLGLDSSGATLLAHLLGFHRREAKPEWWAYFDRHDKSVEDLIDDVESIGGVKPQQGDVPEVRKKSRVYTLEFPVQETKIRAESTVRDPFNDRPAGEVVAINVSEGWLKLLRGPSLFDAPVPTALVPDKPRDNSAQRRALARVADVVADAALTSVRRGMTFSAITDILHRSPPRIAGVASGTPIQTLDLDAQAQLVASLDDSYLFIQGPPGSGKTFTGARLIVSLLKAGKRIGVTANSHNAIHNLLEEVEAVAAKEGVTFRGLKKSVGTEESLFQGPSFENSNDNAYCERSDARVVAGTSWLFAREALEQSFDYLFVDEAGQMALADAIAVATAARNVVLLGDPQQLPHVTQGVHPAGSGVSVLEHLLGGRSTVATDCGVFLAQSWRMHPEICRFISQLAYDGRLENAPGCDRQRIDSSGLTGAGLRHIPIDHRGNIQQSPEEAAAIAREINLLLAGATVTGRDGTTRPITPADILVVAPYNMQVRCLRDALRADVEVGTVDKFQGREAPVIFFSMTSSSGEDVPRGLEFLFNRNRFNVAVSRAKCLSVVVCSPRLLESRCSTVEQMRLVDAACRFRESSTACQSPAAG